MKKLALIACALLALSAASCKPSYSTCPTYASKAAIQASAQQQAR